MIDKENIQLHSMQEKKIYQTAYGKQERKREREREECCEWLWSAWNQSIEQKYMRSTHGMHSRKKEKERKRKRERAKQFMADGKGGQKESHGFLPIHVTLYIL